MRDAVLQGRKDAVHQRGKEDTVLQARDDAVCRGSTPFAKEGTQFVDEGGRML